jgi:membrane-associated protease RseP (regulator of RpoE activity)
MIILAILIYLLGHFIPIWIYKRQLESTTNQFSIKYIILNMNGSVTCFLAALILICIITLSTPEKYLLNENAIYGIECSPTVEELGFKDGDRILMINDKRVERFDDILSNILLCGGTAKVDIRRGETDTVITISDEGKLKLMHSNDTHFAPIKNQLSGNTTADKLIYSESPQTISDALAKYGLYVKMTYKMFFPQRPEYKNVGGFVSISGVNSVKGLIALFSINLILVGFINLLPIPGLDAGNTIVGLIERARHRKFNYRKLKIIKAISITILVTLLLLALIK